MGGDIARVATVAENFPVVGHLLLNFSAAPGKNLFAVDLPEVLIAQNELLEGIEDLFHILLLNWLIGNFHRCRLLFFL